MAVAKYRENGQFFRLPITFVGGELEGEWKTEASYEALSEEDKMKPKNYYVQVDDEEEDDSIATSGQIAHGDTNVGAVLDSINENLTKSKIVRYTSITNSSASAYYVQISADAKADINDNAKEIVSATIGDWSGVGQNMISLSVGNDDKVYLMFPKGTTFSNGSVYVRYSYK